METFDTSFFLLRSFDPQIFLDTNPPFVLVHLIGLIYFCSQRIAIEWREIRMQQDREYKESLEADKKKVFMLLLEVVIVGTALCRT